MFPASLPIRKRCLLAAFYCSQFQSEFSANSASCVTSVSVEVLPSQTYLPVSGPFSWNSLPLCVGQKPTLFSFSMGFGFFFICFFFFKIFFSHAIVVFFFLVSVHTYAYEYLYACTLNGRSRSGDFRNTLLLLTRSHSKIVTIIIIEFVKCISWCWCCTFKSTSELTVNHTRNLRVRKNHDKNKCILTPQISVSAWMKNCH